MVKYKHQNMEVITKVCLEASKLLDIGAWDEVCEVKGLNPWCINEGYMNSSDEIYFSEEELQKCPTVRAYLRRIAGNDD